MQVSLPFCCPGFASEFVPLLQQDYKEVICVPNVITEGMQSELHGAILVVKSHNKKSFLALTHIPPEAWARLWCCSCGVKRAGGSGMHSD